MTPFFLPRPRPGGSRPLPHFKGFAKVTPLGPCIWGAISIIEMLTCGGASRANTMASVTSSGRSDSLPS